MVQIFLSDGIYLATSDVLIKMAEVRNAYVIEMVEEGYEGPGDVLGSSSFF